MKHWDAADARCEGHAEGYREGQRDALLWVARLLTAGPIAKGKAGWVVGVAHLAAIGKPLPDVTSENPPASHATAPDIASDEPGDRKSVRKSNKPQKAS